MSRGARVVAAYSPRNEPDDVKRARKALRQAMRDVQRVQKMQGSGAPVLEASRRLVVPAGRELDEALVRGGLPGAVFTARELRIESPT